MPAPHKEGGMGGKWSEERHLKLAISRMKAIENGKTNTRFLFGPVAVFRHKTRKYFFSAGYNTVELSAYRYNRMLFRKSIKGKKFESFLSDMTDWLRFSNGYVVFRKKGKKSRNRR
jgi:hypothetical protein